MRTRTRSIGAAAVALALLPCLCSAGTPGRIRTRIRWGAMNTLGCAQDPAGNTYVVGYTEQPFDGQTNSPAGETDSFMVKWSADGEWEWTRLWGPTNAVDWATGVAVDGTSWVYVAGSTEGSFGGQTNVGIGSSYLIKCDPECKQDWIRIWGSTNYTMAQGVAFSRFDSNIYVCGETWDGFAGQTNPGESAFFLSCMESDGDHKWSKIWGATNEASATGVAVWDSPDGGDGSIFVAGYTTGEVLGEPFVGGTHDFCLTKWDYKGGYEWTRIWGSTNYDSASSMAVHGKEIIMVGGLTEGDFHGQTNVGRYYCAAITAWNPLGNHIWTRFFGATNRSSLHGLAVDHGGYVYAAGRTEGVFSTWSNANPRGGIFLSQFTVSHGTHQWSRVWGPTNSAFNVMGGYPALQGDHVAVAFHCDRGVDGQVRTGTLSGVCLSTYDIDYHPELSSIAPTGSMVLDWSGAWDHLFNVEQNTNLNDPEGWTTASGIPEMIGDERMSGADPQALPLKAYRVRSRPYTEASTLLGMVYIPAGDFVMGQAGIAEPVHTNPISGFWMDQTEVTKAKYDEVYNWAAANGYVIENPGSGKATDHPVQVVNWYCCVKWANARSEKDGLTPCYYTDAGFTAVYRTGAVDVLNTWVDWGANGYRLPTEAEWEKAARGGAAGYLFPWAGNTISHSQANYYSTNLFAYDVSPTSGYHPTYGTGGFPYTAPVRSFQANGFGLCEMAGNVSEWCWDWYDANYYTNPPAADPKGPASGTHRVRRGGFWYIESLAERCRVAHRDYFFGGPGNGNDTLGFRCVRRAE